MKHKELVIIAAAVAGLYMISRLRQGTALNVLRPVTTTYPAGQQSPRTAPGTVGNRPVYDANGNSLMYATGRLINNLFSSGGAGTYKPGTYSTNPNAWGPPAPNPRMGGDGYGPPVPDPHYGGDGYGPPSPDYYPDGGGTGNYGPPDALAVNSPYNVSYQDTINVGDTGASGGFYTL